MSHGGARPGAGRPDLYRDEFATQAEKLCRLGTTDAEMADFFGVCERTINNWKEAHPEFFERLRRGKLSADATVAERLYQRATGYSHEAVKIFNDGGTQMVVPYTEHYPPDTTAAIFWLKNRRPQQWRDKVQQEFTGADGAQLIPVVNVTLSPARPETSSEASRSLQHDGE